MKHNTGITKFERLDFNLKVRNANLEIDYSKYWCGVKQKASMVFMPLNTSKCSTT